MVGKTHKTTGFFILLALICCIIGSFIGDLAKPFLPGFLSHSFSIGAGPFPLDLRVLSITFDFRLNMNIMSIIGLIAAVFIYKRYW